MNSAYIGNLTIKSRLPYVVYGSVRGLVSEHRSLAAAQRSAEKDRRDCGSLGGGAYSDVSIYGWTDTGWEPMPDPCEY